MSNATILSHFLTLLTRPMMVLLDPSLWYASPNRVISHQPWLLPVTLLSFIFFSQFCRKTRLWVATPALLLLLSQTRKYSTGAAKGDFGRAALIFGFVLRWIDFGLLIKDGEIWKVKRRGNQRSKIERPIEVENGRREGLWQSFTTSLDLWIFNMRGINWSWRVNGIPDRAPQTKMYFLFKTVLRLVGTIAALDLCKVISAQFSYVHLSPRPRFFSQPILVQVGLTWLHQLEAFTFFNIPYQTLALLCVTTNFQTQDDWPPLFGSLSDAYLVSKAWGRTWHQLTRRSLGFATPHVQHLLGVRSRGMKRTTSLLCSFSVSGLAHWSGTLNLPWTPSSHGMFTYFMMQAPIIRMEDYVVEYGKSQGIKENWMWRCLGYLWTVTWISFSMRYAAAFQFESGPLSKFEPLRISLIKLILAKIG